MVARETDENNQKVESCHPDLNHSIIDTTINGDIHPTTTSLRCIGRVFGINSSVHSLTLQNMKMETAQKRLAYHESIWAVKEIDLIEDKRKLQVRIGKHHLLRSLK